MDASSLCATDDREANDGRNRDAVVGQNRRIPELDAIRGWAALSVACFHVFWETFGIFVPSLRNVVTACIFPGHFDVIIFFILSGEALSHPFFCGGGNNYISRAALKRYLRLTIPIVIVATATMSIMFFKLNENVAAGYIVGRPDWLGAFAGFSPGGNNLLKYSLYYVYAGDYPATYLPFLWTMPIEFLGSLVLMIVLFLFPSVKFAEWLVAVVALILVKSDSYLGCFLIGALFSHFRTRGFFDRLKGSLVRILSLALLALSLLTAGRYQLANDQTLLPHAIAGTALLLSIYVNPPLVAFLSRNSFSQFLGRISYLLYLWHFVVLISFTSYLIVHLDGLGALGPETAIAVGIASLGLSIVLSAWTMPIENWTRLANGLLLTILDPKEPRPPAISFLPKEASGQPAAIRSGMSQVSAK